MRKIFFISVILIAVVSCKKEEEKPIEMGSTKKMVITNHNSVSVYPESFSGRNINVEGLDLDGDQIDDIQIMCVYEYSGYFDYYYLLVKKVNPVFNISVAPSSNDHYYASHVTYDYYGTFPRETKVYSQYCTASDSSITIKTHYNPGIYSEDEEVLFTEGYIGNDSLSSHYLLYQASMDSSRYVFNLPGDSLLGYDYNFNDCNFNPPTGDFFYLMFVKNEGSKLRKGWIKMKMNNPCHLTVYESAISEEAL